MPASYLHGVETIESIVGGRSINIVKSAVIGIVGTAPLYTVESANQSTNAMKLLLNDRDAAKYGGKRKTGWTLPAALQSIYAQGSCQVIMINVFDPTTHKTAILAESKTFANNIITLAHEGVSSVVVKSGETTYVVNDDYTVDAENGIITRVSTGDIGATATVTVDYSYQDPTKVDAADIIGTVDENGNRTGLKLFQEAYSKFGFKPKILVTPGFEATEVRTELETLAGKLRAICAVTAPIGTTVQGAIEGRGADGDINFYTSSKRCKLLFPHLKAYDSVSNAYINESYSAYWAGCMARQDIEKGYWWSESNRQIQGIVGVELDLTAEINDPDSEVNALNEAGIMTVFNSFGTGFRTWGNRSASFPSYTAIDNFTSVRRTADVIEESIEYYSLQHMDAPINDALIDDILQSVNGFLKTQIQRGSLIGGSAWYDPANNDKTELANGHLTINYKFLPPPPLERLTYEAAIDINLFRQLQAA
ncbi:MAG: phage tail sheath subtilisin-like domain-containing protein [Candidatus Abawacabacteria bacterium]|nr:phage tail sheath subtilisin-like domain-containing protein [Candidatus Abawacabacteria bacterium]